MNDFTAAQKDKLLTELRAVVADAEELLRATASDTSEGAAEMRGRLQARLHHAHERLAHLQDSLVSRAKEASEATDAFVHDNPWKSIGMVAGLGLLVGILIGRR